MGDNGNGCGGYMDGDEWEGLGEVWEGDNGGKDERTIASVSSVRTSCGHQVEDDSGDLW